MQNTLKLKQFDFMVKDDVKLKNPTLASWQKQFLSTYKIAKKINDKIRIKQFKDDNFQLYCIDNGLLRVKVEKGNSCPAIIKRHGLNNVVLDKVLPDIKLSSDIRINKPIELMKYKDDIPIKVYKNIEKIENKFSNHNIEYFVADVYREPDPFLMFQLDNKKEYTFVFGQWE
jgi:hypothetical protein